VGHDSCLVSASDKSGDRSHRHRVPAETLGDLNGLLLRFRAGPVQGPG
jgi:hypothetical protein